MPEYTKHPLGHGLLVAFEHIALNDGTFQHRAELRVASLVKQIQQNGQLVPVLLRPRPDGRLQLVSGARRVEALRTLGRRSVLAVVRELDDEEAFAASVRDNVERQSLSDIDVGRAILAYQATHPDVTVARLTTVFGMQERKLQRLKQLTVLPDPLKGALRDGKVSTAQAIRLKQLLGADLTDEQVRYWVGRIDREDLTVS